jgi:lysophospholipase L1-like esterase
VRKITPRLPDADGPVEGAVYTEAESPSGPRLEVIVLGESTVAGIGAPTHSDALTGQVARALAKTAGVPVNWLAVGLSGATATDAAERLVPKLRGRRANALVIALGVNDSIDNALNPRTEEKWTRDLKRLIDCVRRELGDIRIVISGAPPLDRFPAFPQPLRSFLGEQSAALDRASIKLAGSLPNVAFAPMVDGLDESHFCQDKFHPSIKGYEAWGKHLIAECGMWIAE